MSPPTPTPTPPTLDEPEQTPELSASRAEAEFDANNPFVSDDDDNWSDHSSLADDIEDSELLKLIDHLDSD